MGTNIAAGHHSKAAYAVINKSELTGACVNVPTLNMKGAVSVHNLVILSLRPACFAGCFQAAVTAIAQDM